MPFVLAALVLAWAVMLLFGGMEFDRGLLLYFYAGDSPRFAAAARIVTELGGSALLLAVTVIGLAVLLVRRDVRGALLLGAITLSGRGLVALQKDWIGTLRPEDQPHLVAAQSYAFPSGHAANATLVWLCLALLLPRKARARMFAIWSAVWLALLIGLSRVMLGVHWPSDVIGGWAFGLFWTLVILRLAGHPVVEALETQTLSPSEAPPTDC
jgi:membrane-associated phospholipid phosphatase